MSEAWPRVSRLGEETWLIELEPRLDVQINADIHRIARAIRAANITGVLDVVPGMASVGVHVDADRVIDADVESRLRQLVANHPADAPAARLHEIPVCYDARFALDIEEVAGRCRCTIADVIAWHTSVEYRVFMIGFLPGFPYLGVVDARLALPRRSVPRERVPRGAVGLAGQQTGIYPFESPGGWHVIGRTPVSLFDPAARPPVRLDAEDRVRFVQISASRFDEIDRGVAG